MPKYHHMVSCLHGVHLDCVTHICEFSYTYSIFSANYIEIKQYVILEHGKHNYTKFSEVSAKLCQISLFPNKENVYSQSALCWGKQAVLYFLWFHIFLDIPKQLMMFKVWKRDLIFHTGKTFDLQTKLTACVICILQINLTSLA